LLLQNDVELEERDYFKEPFTEDELKELAGDTPLSQMFARRSPALKNMGLAGQELSDDEMLALMLKEPRLVRRPLVRMEGQLLVGATVKTLEAALAG
jgi:arsenate reductase